MVERWDAGDFDALYCLVKDDPSTEWWGKLRDRAAYLIRFRERLAHVIGVDTEGKEIEHGGSDFNSSMLVLAKGSREELLDLGQRLRQACGDRADVYPGAWILDEKPAAAEPSSRVAPPRNSGRKGPTKGKRGAKPRKAR